MRKIVRKDNSYRKKILSISLALFAFLGIGYSIVSTNLLFNGNIELSKYESPYLYDVLKFEALRGGLARKYTGEHHDSYTEEPSKDIYHWYADNDTDGTSIQNKNNVIFANHCWQMIRTTDTGGVKMIYNGEAENNQCLNTRGNHVGYSSSSNQTLSSNYWYGTDYTYDSTNSLFSISGTTEQATWNATTGPNLIGKYTCKQTTEGGTCSTLYLVESYIDSSKANAILLNSNSNYSQFGTLQYNTVSESLSGVGYKLGDNYNYSSVSTTSFKTLTSSKTLLNRSTSTPFEPTYLYSKTVTFDGTYYQLDNPILGSNIQEDDYTDYYTFRSSSVTSGVEPFYIVGKYNNTINYYYIKLYLPSQLSDYYIMIGDSITDNGNGTYTLNNSNSVSPIDWYNNYANYKEKYTCGDATTSTCENPRYLSKTNISSYTYINAGKKIVIGKNRNDLTLTDTITVSLVELLTNRTNYTDYKYTCNDENTTCTDTSLIMIESIRENGFSYVPNHYYGSSVTWDGTNYTLVDPVGIENYNNVNNLSTHHYMCLNVGEKSCSQVVYIFYYVSPNFYYITLNNGTTTISAAIEDMLTKNTTNSTIKSGVDAWYRKYLLDYDDLIEDTIYCNRRNVRDYGGWNDNGGLINRPLYFNYLSSSTLDCSNNTDKFSINNTSAQLQYKVALVLMEELNLLNNAKIYITGNDYWLLSPTKNVFNPFIAYVSTISNYSIDEIGVTNNKGVRPAISLKPGTEYVYGDGSMANPYIVKPVYECTYNGELTQGAEFTDGQYTYRYMQEWGWNTTSNSVTWNNINEDGWGVKLTDPTSTNPVNTRLCTSINNKPIVSMRNMFNGSQSTSIDLSSFDTSDVTNMYGMFKNSQAASLNLNTFNTSKVTNMSEMFSGSQTTSLNLNSFNTSKVTDMSNMFSYSNVATLDLSNFDTRNVTNMYGMFEGSKTTSINISSFNTKKVTDMTGMFIRSRATSLDFSNFDNSSLIYCDSMLCDLNPSIIIFGANFTSEERMFYCPV